MIRMPNKPAAGQRRFWPSVELGRCGPGVPERDRSAVVTALIVVGALLLAHVASGADEIKRAVEQGLVTKEMLNALTEDDVPKKWRSTSKDESNERYVKKAFSRGGQKVMVVTWNREWTGAKSNNFATTVYHGKKRLCLIMGFTDGTVTVMPQMKDARDYNLSTSLNKEGKMSVTIMHDEGYFQTVELRGRDTHLLNDLEYTRGALTISQIAKPLAEAIEDEIEKKPRKGKR